MTSLNFCEEFLVLLAFLFLDFRTGRNAMAFVPMNQQCPVNIDDLLAQANTLDGKKRAQEEIMRSGGPVYESDPTDPMLLVEIHQDKTSRRGKFVHRKFVSE